MSYESIQCTRIRLEDNPTCNIGIHFDLVADKIGELINTGPYIVVGRRKPVLRRHQGKISSIFIFYVQPQDPEINNLKS